MDSISRSDWSTRYGLGEHTYCFIKYCKKPNININSRNLRLKKSLDAFCVYTAKHIDVAPVIWCYNLRPWFKNKQVKNDFGFRVRYYNVIGGMPLILECPYGSWLDLTQENKLSSLERVKNKKRFL